MGHRDSMRCKALEVEVPKTAQSIQMAHTVGLCLEAEFELD